ncbi:transposase [Xenorhabdus szentirmaii]|nr:transposase [Xenorhabdus szentirmaii]
MKKVHFTETQVVNILKLTDSGMKGDDICRQNRVKSQTASQKNSSCARKKVINGRENPQYSMGVGLYARQFILR